MIRPGSCRDHCPVDHRFGIDELRTCRFDVRFQRWIGSRSPTLQYPACGQYQSSMAKLSDRFLVLKEMPDDLLAS